MTLTDTPVPTERWLVTGPWGSIEVSVSTVDEMGWKRPEMERLTTAKNLALQDGRIGPGVTAAQCLPAKLV